MLEIIYTKPEKRQVITLVPFAWFGWPLELFEHVWMTIRTPILKTLNIGHLSIKITRYQDGVYRYNGDTLERIDGPDSVLSRVRDVMSFETEADFRRYTTERQL